jgi:hypothetical protein
MVWAFSTSPYGWVTGFSPAPRVWIGTRLNTALYFIADKTAFLVRASRSAAFGAAPPFHFFINEFSDAVIFYEEKISISLMSYLVRYLLSSFLNISQGKFSHLKQNFDFPSPKNSQFLILHRTMPRRSLALKSRHPGHLFFSRR